MTGLSVHDAAQVLGRVLLRNEALHRWQVVTPRAFPEPRQRAVFGAMRDLAARDMPIDEVTLESELQARGELHMSGGLTYLASLAIAADASRPLPNPSSLLEVSLPPTSSRLESIARAVYSRSTYDNLFEPQLADLRLEYAEALAAGRGRLVAWISVRATVAFFETVLAHAAGRIGRIFRLAWTVAGRW